MHISKNLICTIFCYCYPGDFFFFGNLRYIHIHIYTYIYIYIYEINILMVAYIVFISKIHIYDLRIYLNIIFDYTQ